MRHNTKEQSPCCLVFGNHLNAHAIIRGLSEIGIQKEDIWLVKDKGFPRLSAEVLNRKIRTWEIDIHDNYEIVEKIRDQFGITRKKVLFFTDERYLTALQPLKNAKPASDFRFFIGSEKHLDTILDRLRFYDFIEQNRIAPVPRTIPGTEEPFLKLGERVVVRPRVSWGALVKRQRVSIVSSRAALEKVLSQYRQAGLSADNWCFQEVLSIDPIHNVSVCGWFDKRHRHLFCTRKVLQHPEPCGNGDVVEYLPEPPGKVLEQSIALLAALEYSGPFELEWVYDDSSGVYRIIELNPRFWLQHGLAACIEGQQILIKRYVGQKDVSSVPLNCNSGVRYWVNPLFALFRMLRGDFRGLRYYFSPGATHPISLCQALLYAPFHVLGKRSL